MVGLAVAAWTIIPPYVGPALATDDVVEVVDHVVPAVVVVAVGPDRPGRRQSCCGTAMFVGGLVIALAGLWMVLTHVPLLAQASRGEAPWGSAIWHFVPGPVVVALGAAWALLWPSGAEAEAGQEGPPG